MSGAPVPRLADRPWSWLAITALILGCALRFVYAFPVHKYVPDADCLNTGLRALRVLAGQLPVFYTTVRIGCLECYEHAAAFTLLGVSRSWLAIAPLIAGIGLLFAAWRLYRELLGEATGAISLLFLALPSAAWAFWTYMPNSYPETILLCGAVLWLTEVVARRAAPASTFGLGLAAGLGWWNSLQIVEALLPAAAWLLWTRPALLRRRRILLLLAGGFCLGALPWLIYNVRHPLASFRSDFPTRPARGLGAVFSNLEFVATYGIPELVASVDPEATRRFLNPLKALRPAVVAIYVVAVLWAFVAFVRWLVSSLQRKNKLRAPPQAVFLVLVACAVIAVDVLSEAGSRRGLNVRYILPAYLCLAASMGFFLRRLWGASPFLAIPIGAVVLAFNVAGYALWGTPQRSTWRAGLDADARLMSVLHARGVQAVCGNYWLSYPVNFLSREKIVGIPDDLSVDHYGYWKTLSSRPLKWALIGTTDAQLRAWVRKAGLGGAYVRPSPEAVLFLPDEKSSGMSPPRFLQEILSALRRPAT